MVSIVYSSRTNRTACPANSTSAAGSDARADCSCNAGYGGDAATGECLICVPGTYKTDVANTACSICTDDHYCTGGTNRTACPANSTSAAGSDARADCSCNAGYGGDAATGECLICVPGTYKYGIGNAECDVCIAGSYCTGGANILACPTDSNTYAPVPGFAVSISSEPGADAVDDCFATNVVYTSDTKHATGKQTCHYNTVPSKYDANCRDMQVLACVAGYWLKNTSDTDCVAVGNGYYSGANEIKRNACPNLGDIDGVFTDGDTSASVTECWLEKIWVYDNFTGYRHTCHHHADKSDTNPVTGYTYNCLPLELVACAGGYWDDKKTTGDNGVRVCAEVGKNYWSPDIVQGQEPIGHNNNPTTLRNLCPDGGMTVSNISNDITQCYKDGMACDIINGTGENTCNYNNDMSLYIDNCTKCIVTSCNAGYFQFENTCVICPENHVCNKGKETCIKQTQGTHPKSDVGNTDTAYCYTECARAEHAQQMIGRDYYGATDTCEIYRCVPGYTLSNGKCVECPAGNICTPDNPEPQSCAMLTNGEYTLSAPGSQQITDCYKKCESFDIKNGTTVVVYDTVNHPAKCEFVCTSTSGNPGEIVDLTCRETACNYNFEMIGGVCVPCNREFAIEYNANGNCVVETCASGYHPNGQSCEPNVIECTAPHATAATRTWNHKKNAFDECILTGCESGYHLAANACQIDEQTCEIKNGVGIRKWNHTDDEWDECVATKCNPGYTMDNSLTNERWEQCGRCNNTYAENGETAVSSWVDECEIASCMYQGEKYVLVNNECLFICPSISVADDGTGSQHWDDDTKKCVRECQPGYMQW